MIVRQWLRTAVRHLVCEDARPCEQPGQAGIVLGRPVNELDEAVPLRLWKSKPRAVSEHVVSLNHSGVHNELSESAMARACSLPDALILKYIHPERPS